MEFSDHVEELRMSQYMQTFIIFVKKNCRTLIHEKKCMHIFRTITNDKSNLGFTRFIYYSLKLNKTIFSERAHMETLFDSLCSKSQSKSTRKSILILRYFVKSVTVFLYFFTICI